MSLSLHFHNTRGAGLANTLAALQAGVVLVESSLGGLGGCPFAPGATGNVCTEDLVHMFERMGVRTGVNLEALIQVAQQAQAVLGRELPGQVMKAGPADRLYSLDGFVPEYQGQGGASSS
jgi:hydroxymethylglutaryl-CoA lyase